MIFMSKGCHISLNGIFVNVPIVRSIASSEKMSRGLKNFQTSSNRLGKGGMGRMCGGGGEVVNPGINLCDCQI